MHGCAGNKYPHTIADRFTASDPDPNDNTNPAGTKALGNILFLDVRCAIMIALKVSEGYAFTLPCQTALHCATLT